MDTPQHELRSSLIPVIQRDAVKAGKTIIRKPIAVKGEWEDPDYVTLPGSTARKVVGYRRADPLMTLHRRDKMVTVKHIKAAERFRDDWELGNGARPGHEKPEVRGGYGPGGPSDLQLAALQRYTAAVLAVGARQVDILVCVLLGGYDVSGWAEMRGLSRHVAMGMLIANLDRLQEHYENTA